MNDGLNRKPFNILDRLAAIDHLMTVEETSEILNKSISTIYRMARAKQIPSMVISGSRMFDPSTISMWLVKKEPQLAAASRWLLKVAA
jgi:excisionase family DNA binding protein